ncbi:MAG: hypothetical protein ACK5TR_09055 [Alphaproteobacteria bacterium]|jgi:hypothetical protein|nr:hypothetical protein [Alphaproteobacteria bacterium]
MKNIVLALAILAAPVAMANDEAAKDATTTEQAPAQDQAPAADAEAKN